MAKYTIMSDMNARVKVSINTDPRASSKIPSSPSKTPAPDGHPSGEPLQGTPHLKNPGPQIIEDVAIYKSLKYHTELNSKTRDGIAKSIMKLKNRINEAEDKKIKDLNQKTAGMGFGEAYWAIKNAQASWAGHNWGMDENAPDQYDEPIGPVRLRRYFPKRQKPGGSSWSYIKNRLDKFDKLFSTRKISEAYAEEGLLGAAGETIGKGAAIAAKAYAVYKAVDWGTKYGAYVSSAIGAETAASELAAVNKMVHDLTAYVGDIAPALKTAGQMSLGSVMHGGETLSLADTADVYKLERWNNMHERDRERKMGLMIASAWTGRVWRNPTR